MPVPITLPSGGSDLKAGTAVLLFRIPADSSNAVPLDGERFLISTPTDQASTPPITIVLNWHPEPGK